jgi:hypothetical protein
LDYLAESFLPKRPFFFSGIHHCLSFIVAKEKIMPTGADESSAAHPDDRTGKPGPRATMPPMRARRFVQ